MADSGRANEVRKKLEAFRSFKKWGFSDFSGSFSVGSEILPDAWDFCVKNQNGMAVFVSYSEFRNRANVLALISKPKESDSLRVVEWLKQAGRMDEVKRFCIDDFPQNGMARILGALDYLDELLCSDLEDLLAGKRWESTPFDWGNTR